MLHELKISPTYFEDTLHYGKNFEVRKDDRPYDCDDFLWQRAWDGEDYTGDEMLVRVRYIYRGELCKDGYCIMGIEVMSSWRVRQNDTEKNMKSFFDSKFQKVN